MTEYTAVTAADRREMLAAIGVDCIEDLFADIPPALRLTHGLELDRGRSEQEVYAELRELAARNVSTEDELSFVGAGMYDNYVPALIDALTSRAEFLTPYTPYQPEVSQGGLQAMFEYQTAICELTGLPVANASVYEGPSAVAAAGYVATLGGSDPPRRRFVVSRGVHPHAAQTLATLAHGWGMEITHADLGDGRTTLPALGDDVAAVIVSQPNFLGAVEDLATIAAAAHDAGALCIACCDPITLSLLRSPGECGVDIAVGEGQTLGNRLDFGGPSFGFFAVTEPLIRRLPGRIAGETVDLDGRRGFALTLQTREQHIRREKATSNICTAQALNALAGVIYLSWLGRAGFTELGEQLLQRTAYARERLAALPGVALLHEQPVFREFAVTLDAPVERVIERCLRHGVNPGHPLGGDYPEHARGLLVAITELRSASDIDRLTAVLGEAVAAELAQRGGALETVRR